jgi:hypothetical protein
VILAAAALLAACEATPPRYGEVISMKAQDAARVSGYPAPGTTWRLDEADLRALSPAPTLEPPPPPRRPPPAYYPPPPPPPWWW